MRHIQIGHCAAIFTTLSAFSAGALAADRLAVVRVGDGSAALTSAASPVFIDYFTDTGSADGTVAMPTAVSGSGFPLTLSGSATSEGSLRRSVDKRYLTLAGYAAVPGTLAVVSTTSAAVNRVVGRVSATDSVDTTTHLDTAYSGNNIRGAVSDDGTAFWTTGTASVNGGLQYIAFGTTGGLQLTASPTNIRVPGIFGGQLFVVSGSSPFIGVSAVGAGLPTAAGQVTSLLPGLPGASSGPSPYAFVAFDLNPGVAGVDRLYVADDRAAASGGGIQKWTFNGATWTLSATFPVAFLAGARGVTGRVTTGTNVLIYATSAEATANTLVSFVDNGSPLPALTMLAMAGPNTIFRGVDFAAEEPPPPPVPATPPVGGALASSALLALAGFIGLGMKRRPSHA